MPNNVLQKIFPRRLRALAILKLGSVDALHKKVPVCPRAFAYQIRRNALSEPVRDALISQIGADGFLFITGQTNTLTDSAPAAEGHP